MSLIKRSQSARLALNQRHEGKKVSTLTEHSKEHKNERRTHMFKLIRKRRPLIIYSCGMKSSRTHARRAHRRPSSSAHSRLFAFPLVLDRSPLPHFVSFFGPAAGAYDLVDACAPNVKRDRRHSDFFALIFFPSPFRCSLLIYSFPFVAAVPLGRRAARLVTRRLFLKRPRVRKLCDSQAVCFGDVLQLSRLRLADAVALSRSHVALGEAFAALRRRARARVCESGKGGDGASAYNVNCALCKFSLAPHQSTYCKHDSLRRQHRAPIKSTCLRRATAASPPLSRSLPPVFSCRSELQ